MAAVVPSPPHDFAARVQSAQARLAQSVARAGLQGDAYAHVIDAQSAVLGELVAFIDEIRQARQPWTQDERKTAVRDAVKELRQEAGAFVAEATSRRVMLMAGAGLALLLIGAGGGYWWGSSAEAERYANLPAEYNVALKNRNAIRWLDLMRKNAHDAALDGCAEVKQSAGGKACAFVLWTELPPAK